MANLKICGYTVVIYMDECNSFIWIYSNFYIINSYYIEFFNALLAPQKAILNTKIPILLHYPLCPCASRHPRVDLTFALKTSLIPSKNP